MINSIIATALVGFLLAAGALAAGDCGDVIANCRSYGQSVCVDYGDWAKINCNATCQFCSESSKPRPCQDIIDDCAKYASDLCTNAKYKDWAEDNCSKFCGFCISSTTPGPVTTEKKTTSVISVTQTQTPANCVDALNFCFVYSNNACADGSWADKYCRKTCTRC